MSLARTTRAAHAAALAHAGQTRGVTGEPYVNHLAEVAALVAEAGEAEGWGSADAVAAAWLHDAVEDGLIATDDLVTDHGGRVGALVAPLTDDADWDDLPTTEKKARQADRIADADPDARRIKIADQTSNCLHRARTMAPRDPARMAAYLDGARAIVDRCRGASPCLEARFDEAAAMMERALDERREAA